jgi:hypothetical protein
MGHPEWVGLPDVIDDDEHQKVNPRKMLATRSPIHMMSMMKLMKANLGGNFIPRMRPIIERPSMRIWIGPRVKGIGAGGI